MISGFWISYFIFHHWIMIFENAEWVGCGCGVTSQDERAVLIISLFFFSHCINMQDRGYPIPQGTSCPQGGTLDLFLG